MTKYEIVKAHSAFFKMLLENGIDPKEVQYLDMVEEYRELKARKHKVCYIVSLLSEKHHLTERAVYKIVKRFNQRIVI